MSEQPETFAITIGTARALLVVIDRAVAAALFRGPEILSVGLLRAALSEGIGSTPSANQEITKP